jgi:hypothetical protein
LQEEPGVQTQFSPQLPVQFSPTGQAPLFSERKEGAENEVNANAAMARARSSATNRVRFIFNPRFGLY